VPLEHRVWPDEQVGGIGVGDGVLHLPLVHPRIQFDEVCHTPEEHICARLPEHLICPLEQVGANVGARVGVAVGAGLHLPFKQP
jgi:hypothetical protein